MEDFIKLAKKVLLGNKKKGYTLPTNNKLYPAQWNWDSGFIALGYSHFKFKYALDEIKTLIRGQWKDGMIPHILFHDLNTNYYPYRYKQFFLLFHLINWSGPSFWKK